MKKILLTTLCGPFGADTDDCTKHVMPELFHAQVTRSQGVFSLRSTYISYGLEYIAKNITTPTVLYPEDDWTNFPIPYHLNMAVRKIRGEKHERKKI